MIRWFAERKAAKGAAPAAAPVAAPAPAQAPAAAPGPDMTTIAFPKFYDESPGPQSAVDIFKGRWSSKLPDAAGRPLVSGDAALFDLDLRPQQAGAALGDASGRLDGFKVLELGPLEAGHSYQLEHLGANVTAIEGNAEAFLKCLIVKEIYGLKANFVLGDFVRYMRETDRQFDLVFASGVLYHMVRPLELIELICRTSSRAFLWTHFYDPAFCTDFEGEAVEHAGLAATHYRKNYGDRTHGRFWGGLADEACWLTHDDILNAFRAFGHTKIEIVQTHMEHPHGPSFTVATSR